MKALFKITGKERGLHILKINLILLAVWFASALFTSCENDAFTNLIGKEEELGPIVVTLTGVDVVEVSKAVTLEEAFRYIKDNIEDGETYYIDVSGFADNTLYLPPAGKRYFWGLEEQADPTSPNCLVYPVLKGVTISIINTGKTGKTIRLRRTAQSGFEYNSADLGSLFYIEKKVNFVIDGMEGGITLKGISSEADAINNNCPLVLIMNDGAFTLKGGAVIKDNSNIDGDNEDGQSGMCRGGAVYMANEASFTMENSSITNCLATSGGGVYMIEGTTLYMHSGAVIGGNRCTGNYAVGGGGGVKADYGPNGVYIKQKHNIYMNGNAKITNNIVAYEGRTQSESENESSNQRGGGVYFEAYGDGSEFIMRDNAEISGNKIQGAASEGGGVFIWDNGDPSNCDAELIHFEMYGKARVANNTAGVYERGYSSGGGVYIGSGNMIMHDNSKVSGNTAQGATGRPAEGGGVYVASGDAARNAALVMSDNSIIEGNQCIAVTESAKPGIGSGVVIEDDGANNANGKIKLMLSGSARIPPAGESSTMYYNTIPLDDTTNSILVHFYRAQNNPSGNDDPAKAADPYISISDGWRPSGILIDAAADTASPDIEKVEHNRRRVLARYKDDTGDIPQNTINAFRLNNAWKIISIDTKPPEAPTSLADKWKIDNEGYLVER